MRVTTTRDAEKSRRLFNVRAVPWGQPQLPRTEQFQEGEVLALAEQHGLGQVQLSHHPVERVGKKRIDRRTKTDSICATKGHAANTAYDTNVWTCSRQVLLLDAAHQILRRPSDDPPLPRLGSESEHTRTGSW